MPSDIPEADSHRSQLALSLFGVLLAAKVIVVVEAGVSQFHWSPWLPVALLWHDVAVALVAAAIGHFMPRLSRSVRSTIYAVAVIYIALSVPITMTLGSPLTWTLIRAAGAPLADSIRLYLRFSLLSSIVLLIAAGLLLPVLLRRFRKRVPIYFLGAAVAVAVIGPFASQRAETFGLDRNALTALLPLSRPTSSGEMAASLRQSPFDSRTRADLSRFRGAAAGMNVVVVILESTAARYLRPYGAAEDPMPNLTALSRRAIVFNDAYAVYPESVKGLYATLCGRYPAFGIDGDAQARVPCVSVASAFAAAGYRTGLFHSGRFRYLGMEALIANKGFGTLEDAGAIGGQVESSFGVDEPSAVGRILSWIDAKPGAPFFTMYLPAAGHHPYASSRRGPFSVSTEVDRYRNAIHEGDEALGTLIDGLRSRGLADRTMVVVFGDHGEAFQQHPGNIGHTLQIYDENVRVPYLISIPGATMTETRAAGPASLVDTAATLRDLTGLPAEPGQQGTSLLASGSRMAFFFTDYSLGWLGLRDGCWKFLYEMSSKRAKLFDVCGDPDERRDAAAAQHARVAAYSERVQQWIGSIPRG
jgi:hypothetical protein